MAKQWYIVHTFSGYEQKAKAALEERIKALGKQDYFGEILVPVEKVVELVKGKKKTSSRKFFPGYILVQMTILGMSLKKRLRLPVSSVEALIHHR
jgi:transcription termination/antitermination protein NusG